MSTEATARPLGPLPALIFSSRWLQLPLYLGLIVAQGVYVFLFLKELWHLIHDAPMLTEQSIMLIVLGLIDVVMIIGLTPAGCVVKEALFRNPFVRRVVQAAGYISNDSTGAMIERAAAALRGGDTLVMFPEGTRTRPGEPLAFHRGAASVALQADTVLTPVYITSDPVFLPKHRPWYRVPPTRPHLVLRVGEDLDLEPYRGLPPPRASRLLNDWLQEHYTRALGMAARYNPAQNAACSRTTGTTEGPRLATTDRGVTTS